MSVNVCFFLIKLKVRVDTCYRSLQQFVLTFPFYSYKTCIYFLSAAFFFIFFFTSISIVSIINQDLILLLQKKLFLFAVRVKKESNLKKDRLCRSTTVPTVNLTHLLNVILVHQDVYLVHQNSRGCSLFCISVVSEKQIKLQTLFSSTMKIR